MGGAYVPVGITFMLSGAAIELDASPPRCTWTTGPPVRCCCLSVVTQPTSQPLTVSNQPRFRPNHAQPRPEKISSKMITTVVVPPESSFPWGSLTARFAPAVGDGVGDGSLACPGGSGGGGGDGGGGGGGGGGSGDGGGDGDGDGGLQIKGAEESQKPLEGELVPSDRQSLIEVASGKVTYSMLHRPPVRSPPGFATRVQSVMPIWRASVRSSMPVQSYGDVGGLGGGGGGCGGGEFAVQMTPASSLCSQLLMPQALCAHEEMYATPPRPVAPAGHSTSSSQMGPDPSPKNLSPWSRPPTEMPPL